MQKINCTALQIRIQALASSMSALVNSGAPGDLMDIYAVVNADSLNIIRLHP